MDDNLTKEILIHLKEYKKLLAEKVDGISYFHNPPVWHAWVETVNKLNSTIDLLENKEEESMQDRIGSSETVAI
jgi:hypothetical protein